MFKWVYEISQTDHWALCKICTGMGQINSYGLIFGVQIASFLVKISHAKLFRNSLLVDPAVPPFV